jgi:hypothetical protein
MKKFWVGLLLGAASCWFASPAYAQQISASQIGPMPLPPSALAKTASVIEGTVTDISYTYDAVLGPRTVTTLSTVKRLRGSPVPSSVVLDTFGGYLPDGHFVDEAHTPSFPHGARVLVFLRNSSWYSTPVLHDWIFRIENRWGKRVILTLPGQSVMGVARSGPKLGPLVERFNWQRGPLIEGAGEGSAPIVESALKSAMLDVDSFLQELDVVRADEGVTNGGTFDPYPTLPDWMSQWDIFPASPDPDFLSEEELMCVDAGVASLTCGG